MQRIFLLLKLNVLIFQFFVLVWLFVVQVLLGLLDLPHDFGVVVMPGVLLVVLNFQQFFLILLLVRFAAILEEFHAHLFKLC